MMQNPALLGRGAGFFFVGCARIIKRQVSGLGPAELGPPYFAAPPVLLRRERARHLGLPTPSLPAPPRAERQQRSPANSAGPPSVSMTNPVSVKPTILASASIAPSRGRPTASASTGSRSVVSAEEAERLRHQATSRNVAARSQIKSITNVRNSQYDLSANGR